MSTIRSSSPGFTVNLLKPPTSDGHHPRESCAYTKPGLAISVLKSSLRKKNLLLWPLPKEAKSNLVVRAPGLIKDYKVLLEHLWLRRPTVDHTSLHRPARFLEKQHVPLSPSKVQH